MRKAYSMVFTMLFVGAFCALTPAQSGGTYLIQKSVIAGGGDTSSGGTFSVTGTIGEAGAGTTASGGTFRIGSGFWGAEFAGFSVSGRVTSASTRGITNALVSLSGGPLTTPRVTRTTRYGGFDFDNVAPGYTYTLTVAARRFGFAQSTQPVTVTDNVNGIMFTANP